VSAEREISCPSAGRNLSAYQEYLLSAVMWSLGRKYGGVVPCVTVVRGCAPTTRRGR
jgi:hypothetical protein